MNQFEDKIAVITGAASGIGRSLALKAAQLKMKVVVADVEQQPLLAVADELKTYGAEVKAVVTDITDCHHVERLAEETMAQFGVPHLLFNNAGVGGPAGPIWEIPIEKLQWVLNVNLMGVVYGLKSFVPWMLNNGEESHIINTASMAGMYTAPYISCYQISKHAVVALTEALYHDLQVRNSKIGVSLLCPGWVKTNILNDVRNAPLPEEELVADQFTDEDIRWMVAFAKSVKRGIASDEVADIVFDAIKQKRFYIFTHPEMKKNIVNRSQSILAETAPVELEF